jgi:predicted DNA-binding transcriptional regulator AlpA
VKTLLTEPVQATVTEPDQAAATEPLRKRILKHQDVLNLVQVSRGTLRRWMRKGKFPQPLAIGSRTTLLWDREEVEAALLKRRQEHSELEEWRRARAARAKAEAQEQALAQRGGSVNRGATEASRVET